MKTALEILVDLRKLLSHPNRWCQGHGAISADGKRVAGTSFKAVKWCVLGGLSKCSLMEDGTTSDQYYKTIGLIEDTVLNSVGAWNDSHTHPEVLSAIDKAIEKAQGKFSLKSAT